MGGIDGHYDWLDALQDGAHESHEEALGWLEENFDPARFDLDLANKRPKSTFRLAPRKKPNKLTKKND